jgi:hypothetical protein
MEITQVWGLGIFLLAVAAVLFWAAQTQNARSRKWILSELAEHAVDQL